MKLSQTKLQWTLHSRQRGFYITCPCLAGDECWFLIAWPLKLFCGLRFSPSPASLLSAKKKKKGRMVVFCFAFVAVTVFSSLCSGRVSDVYKRQDDQSLKTQLQNICDRKYSASKESQAARRDRDCLLILGCLAAIVGDKLFINGGQDLKNRNTSTLQYVNCMSPRV